MSPDGLREQLLQFFRAPCRILVPPEFRRDLRVPVVALALVMRVRVNHLELALFERLAAQRRAQQRNSRESHRSRTNLIRFTTLPSSPCFDPVQPRVTRDIQPVVAHAGIHAAALHPDRRSRSPLREPEARCCAIARSFRRPPKPPPQAPIPPPRSAWLAPDRTPRRRASRRRRLARYSRTSWRSRATETRRPPCVVAAHSHRSCGDCSMRVI